LIIKILILQREKKRLLIRDLERKTMTTKNITDHYKKYGVIEGDKLLLETAKNNYQKGKEHFNRHISGNICCKGCFELGRAEAKKEADEKIKWEEEQTNYWFNEALKIKKEKAELIEKIKSELRDYFDKEYYNDFPSEAFDILDTFKSPQHEEIPAMGRTEDSLGNGKTKHNSTEDIQSQQINAVGKPMIPSTPNTRGKVNLVTADKPQEDLIVGSPVVSNSLDNCTHVAPKGEFKSNSLKFGMGIENLKGCGKEFIGFNDKGKKIKSFCWDKDKLGDWRCPECRARDKK
jgi:hypothetical protein